MKNFRLADTCINKCIISNDTDEMSIDIFLILFSPLEEKGGEFQRD